MIFCPCGLLAAGLLLGLTPSAEAQRPGDKIKNAEAAVKKAEEALGKEKSDSKRGGPCHGGPASKSRHGVPHRHSFGHHRSGWSIHGHKGPSMHHRGMHGRSFGMRFSWSRSSSCSNHSSANREEMWKRMAKFFKAMKARHGKISGKQPTRKSSDRKPKGPSSSTAGRGGPPKGFRPSFRGFGSPKRPGSGIPGFGRRPSFPSKGTPKSGSSKTSVEQRLDRLAKEIEALRRELKKK